MLREQCPFTMYPKMNETMMLILSCFPTLWYTKYMGFDMVGNRPSLKVRCPLGAVILSIAFGSWNLWRRGNITREAAPMKYFPTQISTSVSLLAVVEN